MEIFVNEQPLNFTLEGEELFSQVRIEVTKWLAAENYIIEGCTINGDPVELDNLEDWDGKRIDQIDHIRFEVRPLIELNFERLQTVYNYLMLIKKGIESDNAAMFSELSKEYPIIETQLTIILNEGSEDMKNSDVLLFSNLLESSGFLQGKIEMKDSLQNALSMCKSFMATLESRMHEITNPQEELKSTAAHLTSLIEPMNEIPVLLQTGKDRDAMQTVLNFIEASQKMLRLYPILKSTSDFDMQRKLKNGETLEQFYAGFNSILLELQKAFSASDSILIGDLLEYEISPRIENLATLINP